MGVTLPGGGDCPCFPALGPVPSCAPSRVVPGCIPAGPIPGVPGASIPHSQRSHLQRPWCRQSPSPASPSPVRMLHGACAARTQHPRRPRSRCPHPPCSRYRQPLSAALRSPCCVPGCLPPPAAARGGPEARTAAAPADLPLPLPLPVRAGLCGGAGGGGRRSRAAPSRGHPHREPARHWGGRGGAVRCGGAGTGFHRGC